MGSVVRSNSPGSSLIESASARCWARRKPCVRTAALGCPVLPLVKVIRAGSSRAGSGSWSLIAWSHRRACLVWMLMGIPLISEQRNRRKCALVEPTNAFGRQTREHALRWVKPAEGSMKTAVAPDRKIPRRIGYRATDIGTKTKTFSSFLTPRR